MKDYKIINKKKKYQKSLHQQQYQNVYIEEYVK